MRSDPENVQRRPAGRPDGSVRSRTGDPVVIGDSPSAKEWSLRPSRLGATLSAVSAEFDAVGACSETFSAVLPNRVYRERDRLCVQNKEKG